MTFVTPTPLYQGDTWQVDCVLDDATGAVLDLTSYTVSAILHVGASKVSATATVTNATAGAVLVQVAASSTGTIPGDPPCQPFDAVYPTRLQVITTDTAGDSVTRKIIPIQVIVP